MNKTLLEMKMLSGIPVNKDKGKTLAKAYEESCESDPYIMARKADIATDLSSASWMQKLKTCAGMAEFVKQIRPDTIYEFTGFGSKRLCGTSEKTEDGVQITPGMRPEKAGELLETLSSAPKDGKVIIRCGDERFLINSVRMEKRLVFSLYKVKEKRK